MQVAITLTVFYNTDHRQTDSCGEKFCKQCKSVDVAKIYTEWQYRRFLVFR